jgi:protein phosphatase
VAARRVYAEPSRPFAAPDTPSAALSVQQQLDDVLDLADVAGKRIVNTRLHHNVTIREENGIAALEVMSRFAVNPKWLVYLPPTMSPSETSKRPGYLEHPTEAFDYFRHHGTPKVVCEEKHMGSRAVIVLCRDEEAASRRFGVLDEGNGIIYTRTGRRFFDDVNMERELLSIITNALVRSDFWSRLRTDWVCLDCELMPWSAKAQELIRRQYAPVAVAARASLAEANAALAMASQRGAVEDDLLSRYRDRQQLATLYERAYERYSWPVQHVTDLKLAPFHILATEGAVHVDKDHEWHMEMIAGFCGADMGEGVLMTTSYRVVDVTDADSQTVGAAWWEELTERGGEGMVVKPLSFIARGRGLLQPAVKCRGREYLRIIYGPEYSLPENLDRLRSRGLGHKRSLALREFALGVEALERFVRREPLRRVHECVFGVLALESEPVDPRL